MPQVSIIIPAHAAPAFVEDAVESALRQTWRDREILVIDTGSDDGLGKRLARFSGRIRTVEARSRGAGSPWGRGIAEAAGRWLAFLDPHDIWIDMKTEVQMDLARARPEIGWWASSCRELRGGREVRREGVARPSRLLGGAGRIHRSTVLLRRECLEAAGPLGDDLDLAQDDDLWRRLARASPPGYTPGPLALCRRPPRGEEEETAGESPPDRRVRVGDPERALGAVDRYVAALQEGGVRILREGHRGRVVRLGDGDGEIVLKHYREAGLSGSLRALIGGTKARRAWRRGEALARRGLGVPGILGVVERRWQGLPCDSLLLMEPIPGAVEMDRALHRRRPTRPTDGETRSLLLAFARTLRTMHEEGFHHADLKSCNVLVHGEAPSWGFTFLDLEDVSDRGWVPLRLRLENLAQLNATVPAWIPLSDRLRFLLAVLGRDRLDAEGKALFRRVLARSREKDRVHYDDEGVVREAWPESPKA